MIQLAANASLVRILNNCITLALRLEPPKAIPLKVVFGMIHTFQSHTVFFFKVTHGWDCVYFHKSSLVASISGDILKEIFWRKDSIQKTCCLWGTKGENPTKMYLSLVVSKVNTFILLLLLLLLFLTFQHPRGEPQNNYVCTVKSCWGFCSFWQLQCSFLSNSSGPYCNRTWDGWLCWDDTPAGAITQQHCPDYFPEFDPTGGILIFILYFVCSF